MISKTCNRIKSFRYAIKGLIQVVRTQKNMQIHIVVGLISVMVFYYVGISKSEWIAVIIVSGLVLICESINTAIECLGDAYSKEYNYEIGKSKDIGAGAVLISAIVAISVGLIIISNHL